MRAIKAQNPMHPTPLKTFAFVMASRQIKSIKYTVTAAESGSTDSAST